MNTRAKKSMGQNFLSAPSIVKKMIDVSKVGKSDVVIEVGPGKGALTSALLLRNIKVIAYELDSDMLDFLNEKFATEIQSGQLKLHHGNILDVPPSHFKNINYKVIANIPYYITNAIIRYFLEQQVQPSSLCLLVQNEVANRIARDKKESILSLSVKAFGNPSYITKVPRRYFSPKPKVDSAVILISDISRKNFTSIQQQEKFFVLIKKAFGQKRKQLATNLKDENISKSEYQEILLKLGYKKTARAEEVSLSSWLNILQIIKFP